MPSFHSFFVSLSIKAKRFAKGCLFFGYITFKTGQSPPAHSRTITQTHDQVGIHTDMLSYSVPKVNRSVPRLKKSNRFWSYIPPITVSTSCVLLLIAMGIWYFPKRIRRPNKTFLGPQLPSHLDLVEPNCPYPRLLGSFHPKPNSTKIPTLSQKSPSWILIIYILACNLYIHGYT